MLVEAEIASEPPLHKRERPVHRGARKVDLVDRMRRFELHPIDLGRLAVGSETGERLVPATTKVPGDRHWRRRGHSIAPSRQNPGRARSSYDRGAITRDRLLQ